MGGGRKLSDYFKFSTEMDAGEAAMFWNYMSGGSPSLSALLNSIDGRLRNYEFSQRRRIHAEAYAQNDGVTWNTWRWGKMRGMNQRVNHFMV